MQYPEGMTKLYSNFTPRGSRLKRPDGSLVQYVVVTGIQHFVLEYLIKHFNENFFGKRRTTEPRPGIKDPDFKAQVIAEYKRHIPVDTAHIEELWDLGYLPLELKALDEGTLCPVGVPMLTITNTHPNFGWLVNYLETLMSCMLWQMITSATIAFEFKRILTRWAKQTDEKNIEFVNWQGHDFSMRGMSSVESAILSGMGHLLSFTGTDTIPVIYQLEQSYNADGLIGASVPATEHSVMCMGTKESEIETFSRLIDLHKNSPVLSIVSGDLWKVLTEYLPALKDKILAGNTKIVIRPDSGDSVDIICGHNYSIKAVEQFEGSSTHPAFKGVIELLWDIFGGTINEQGYKVLDPHIGAIYGDSITMERAEQICEKLAAKGFASTNVVFGIGSYTYQYNTRDTFKMAMKATYGEITHPPTGNCKPSCKGNGCVGCKPEIEAREIFKDPVTDDGSKRSKKGLLCVIGNETGMSKNILVKDQCTWEQEQRGLLTTVFKDGKLVKTTTLAEIRERLKAQA